MRCYRCGLTLTLQQGFAMEVQAQFKQGDKTVTKGFTHCRDFLACNTRVVTQMLAARGV